MLLHYNQNLTFSELFHLWSLLIHGWRYLRWQSLVSCWRLWIGFVVIVCFTLTLRASSVSNQSDSYVSITRIFITITYDQNTFWAILFCTVGASAVSDDPLFTFSLWMWGSFFFFAEHTQLMQNCTWHPSREIFLLRRQASSHLCGMSRRLGGRQKANSWGFS